MTTAAYKAPQPGPRDGRLERIQGHLEKMLTSALFAGTRRLKPVLRYLVRHALDGTSVALNEYRLAVEAFGRSESFDPGTDPIVRVEMSRLRTRLERYYGDYIVDDGISFELPRGTYALTIRDAAADHGSRFTAREPPTIIIGVSPLHAAPGTYDTQTLCVQLAKELVEILGNEPYVATAAPVTWIHPRRDPDLDFVVDGSIQAWSPLVYATMRLIDVGRDTFHVLGHYVYALPMTFTARMDLSSAIMTDIRSHLLTRNRSVLRVAPRGRDGLWPEQHERQYGVSEASTESIVDAAIATFADHGYFDATVEAIALRAQVPKRVLLDIFGNKVVLFIESVRLAAERALNVTDLELPRPKGDLQRKAVQLALRESIRRWYDTLSIERARLTIYSGLKEHVEYQRLIQEPITRLTQHLVADAMTETPAAAAGEETIRAGLRSLILLLIYFRVAPWSPESNDVHDAVVDALVKQSLASLFGGVG